MRKKSYYEITYISGTDDKQYAEDLKDQEELMGFIAVVDYYDGEILKVEKKYA